MEKYRFKTSHMPLDLNKTLYDIAKERPEEWALIQDLLSKKSSMDSNDISASTVGELIQLFLDNLASNDELNLILFDLCDSYSPLKLSLENSDIKQDISTYLGEDVQIKVSATGVPTPKYDWFFWSQLNPTENWQLIEGANGPEITISDLRLSDIGIYRCYVSHFFPVVDDNGDEVPGIYSGGHEVTVDPLSILITEQPPQVTNCLLMDDVELKIEAECLNAIGYQWYHNGKICDGEQSPVLKMAKICLNQGGSYKCRITSAIDESVWVETDEAKLAVQMPDAEQLSKFHFDNEQIEILLQPRLGFENVKAAIGEKVHLSCLASCKYPLKYEWLKRGIRSDLIGRSKENFTYPELVGFGCHLVDEIEDAHPPVSSYMYQCLIKCPQTNERLASSFVRVPVSTYTLPDKSLPVFKIALLICQEEYDHQESFHALTAPKSDGKALTKALQQLDFEVMAFSNLTVDEIKKAVDLVCSFINEQTYVFFYFNGHALGHGSDIYLVGRDTNLDLTDRRIRTMDQLVWHGEIETNFDKQHPLLATIIYDSCRDQLPDAVVGLVNESSRQHEPIQCESNFCIGYGTRQSKRSFVKMDKSGFSQSLYTKYLLQHICTKDISISSMFERLNCSFTMGEDASIVAQMKPEFKDSTRQAFCLAAPLRHSSASRQHKLFFQLCRLESISRPGPFFEDFTNCIVGLSWCSDSQSPVWIVGRTNKSPDVMVRMSIVASEFLNEASLEVSMALNSPKEKWMDSSFIQVIPVNSLMIVAKNDHELTYWPCHGKRDTFEDKDGPLFKMSPVSGENMDYELIGRCHIPSLQSVPDPALKFRVLLSHAGKLVKCKGCLSLASPMTQNIPSLKISNSMEFSL